MFSSVHVFQHDLLLSQFRLSDDCHKRDVFGVGVAHLFFHLRRPHWQRVERNGILLSSENGRIREDINIKVVRFFAYLHDKCRLDNWTDIEHGVRAADMLSIIRNTILRDFTDEEVSLLERACRYHTTEHRTGNPTIDVCFDADRLDLGRVGIVPNPRRMATEQGAYYAANIYLIDELRKL